MFTEEVRKRVLKILKLSGKKRIEELHKIGAEFEKNKDIQLLIDSYIFNFKSHTNRLEVSELIDKIESYKDDVKDEVLFMILLGRLNIDQKQYEKAEAYFKLAIEKNEGLVYAYNGLGNLYKAQKEYEKAEESYKLAIEKDKDYAGAYNNLGILYKAQKEYEKAEESYKLAIEKDKDDASAYNNLGILYSEQKEYEKAEESYKLAIEKDEDFAHLYNGLGILYSEQKEYEKAEESYKLAIEKDKDYAGAYNNLGILYSEQEEYEKAEEYFKLAIEKDKDYASAYNNLGILYKAQKEYEKAEESYKLAIEKDKDYASAYSNLGILYKAQKEYEKAEESYKIAIEKDKDYASAYNGLGNLYYEQEEYEKAEEYFKLAIEKDRDYAEVYNNLGNLYKAQKEYEKAEESYKRAIKKNENLANPYNGLGILYKAQKQYGKAEEYFKLAIKKDEHYFLAYRNLGNLYKIRGNLELSEQMFKSAKKISSNEKSKLKTSLIDLEIEKLEAIKIRERKEEGEKKSDFIMKTSHLFRSIDQRKREFNKFITDDKRNEKLFKLEVLRRWNSYTPIIANNFHVSKGGGYFLNLNGHGCVVDPGFNFIDNFKGSGKCFKMIDSVIVSHAHNDHESDLESILTLLYKYNEEVKCLDFHDADDDDFDESKYKGTIRYDIAERENIAIKDVREEAIEKEFLVSSRRKTIDLYIPESVYKKYQGMLDLYGNNNYKFIRIKKNQSETINGFEVHFMWAKHRDIISSEHSLGFYLVHEKNALIYTGDTGWTKEVEKHYRKIKQQLKDKEIILIAHLGGFKDKEENFMYKNSDEEKCTYGNHLGRLGLVGINEVLEPKLCIVSEFGEEFKGSRIKICEILNELFKTTHFLPADIGLNYNFKNNMVKAIFKMDTYRDIIEENHYKEIPFENVSPILLRADYSLHYYDKNSDVIPDELTQALTKEYYTSPR